MDLALDNLDGWYAIKPNQPTNKKFSQWEKTVDWVNFTHLALIKAEPY